MSDFTNKIKELENKNQELSNELAEISKSINPEKIKRIEKCDILLISQSFLKQEYGARED